METIAASSVAAKGASRAIKHFPSSPLALSLAKIAVETAHQYLSATSKATPADDATSDETEAFEDDVDGDEKTLSFTGISIGDTEWDLLFGETSHPLAKLIRKLVSMALENPQFFDHIRTLLFSFTAIERPLAIELPDATDIDTALAPVAEMDVAVAQPAGVRRPPFAFPFFPPATQLLQHGGAALAFPPWDNSRAAWAVRQQAMEKVIETTSAPETVALKKAALELAVRAGQSPEAAALRQRAYQLVVENGGWKYGLAMFVANGVVRGVLVGAGIVAKVECPMHTMLAAR